MTNEDVDEGIIERKRFRDLRKEIRKINVCKL